MAKDIDKLAAEKGQYDKASQDIIDSLIFAKGEIAAMDSMKRTEGWKILQERIREELVLRISTMVEDDPKIQTLLSLLKLADTKKRRVTLEAEIEKLLPE